MGWFPPTMKQLPHDVPELYLYSEGDKLVSHSIYRKSTMKLFSQSLFDSAEIQEFISIRRQRGAQCSEFNFGKGSPHINHFGVHPELYKTQLQKFFLAVGTTKASSATRDSVPAIPKTPLMKSRLWLSCNRQNRFHRRKNLVKYFVTVMLFRWRHWRAL